MKFVVALLLSLAALLCTGAAAPQPAPSSRAVLNLRDFDFVTSKIRDNYAGWHTKVTADKRPQLDALTRRLRSQAAQATDAELLALLREWIAFFDDRHVGIAPAGAGAGAASKGDYPAVRWDDVTARLAALAKSREPLEGVWNIQGDLYRLAVLRSPTNPDRFEAVVLTTKSPSWKPGQIKAEFTRRADGKFDSLFRSGDHGEHRQVAELVAAGQAVAIPGWDTWVREWPPVPDLASLKRMLPPRELTLDRYSDDTLLLRIPDFNDTRAKPLRELIETHREQLTRTPNLIIDLRNNGGGSDFVYKPIVPYLYTRPIVTIGMEMRATRDNIALRQEVANRLRDEAPDQTRELENQIRQMRARIGQYVITDPRQFEIETHDKVLPYPQRVAVLIDGAGSTGEQFLLLARQSRKVTLFGQRNSAGVLDFANVIGTLTPSGRYRLNWATSRSLRLPEDPVDPDGIPPDVTIPEAVTDPIAFAADWLVKQFAQDARVAH